METMNERMIVGVLHSVRLSDFKVDGY